MSERCRIGNVGSVSFYLKHLLLPHEELLLPLLVGQLLLLCALVVAAHSTSEQRHLKSLNKPKESPGTKRSVDIPDSLLLLLQQLRSKPFPSTPRTYYGRRDGALP